MYGELVIRIPENVDQRDDGCIIVGFWSAKLISV